MAVNHDFVVIDRRQNISEHRTGRFGQVLPGRVGGVAMKSSALIPFVVVVAAYSAQAAEQRKLTEPPVSHFRGTCESDPDGKKFAAKACYTSYYPGKQGYYRGYTPPTCDPKQEVTDQQREVLAKAYSRAPDYMKGKLCRLTQLFVTGSTMEGP